MKTYLYARVSTEDQNCEVQMLELRAFCKAKKWTVVGEFTDVMSGGKAERPGLTQVMAGVHAGAVEAVCVVKLDRLARSLRNFAVLVEEFDKANVALVCTSQGIDTSKSNACGRMMMNVLGAIAEFERAMIRERTQAGMVAARARGARIGRPSVRLPPLQYRAPIVAEWRAQGGKGYAELARRLGGVSPATAWRLAHKLPAEPVELPSEPTTISIEE